MHRLVVKAMSVYRNWNSRESFDIEVGVVLSLEFVQKCSHGIPRPTPYMPTGKLKKILTCLNCIFLYVTFA